MIRKTFWSLTALLGVYAGGAVAGTYNLTIDETVVNITGRETPAMAINGGIPGPVLRFKEGENVVINVTNNLDVTSSMHWHGFIIPPKMDGVPGISYDGIKPGETFTYRFPIVQNGTYWYHSHSGLQEQAGVFGAIVITPKKRDPVKYDREHVIILSDWSDEKPETVLSNLKKQSDYYNYNKRTVFDFFKDVEEKGLSASIDERKMWGEMRMDATDIVDVTGYTFLMNGKNPAQNWTGLFKPGERVRLRFINGSAMTYFKIRIPGLKMTVVAADGQNLRPTTVDEFQIAVAEAYDVIVQPKEDRAYTIFAAPMDNSGYARATLATRQGDSAAIPALEKRPVLTMADMPAGAMAGMDHSSMKGMDHGSMKMDDKPMAGMDHGSMKGMDHSSMKMGDKPMAGMDHSSMKGMKYGSMKGMDHSAMKGMNQGAKPAMASKGHRILKYGDLKSLLPNFGKKPERELVLRLTGNMERYFWSINDKKYSEAEPIRFKHNERVRVTFINTTMMNHPMHLHGHWMELVNGSRAFKPRKHVINVRPGQTVSFDLTADALGEWAFHCHLLYHMATGMFRKVIVEPAPEASLPPATLLDGGRVNG
ncbi:MAG: copper resistance system multicopper oxidase [Alphaproteobacteria bacterium]|nr:copper resistance system multicopper oxidase [Alphaproteobacteria bacterium]